MSIRSGYDLEKTPIFRVDGGDLHYLAKTVSKLDFNNLSPFKGQPESIDKPSVETMGLVRDAEFKALVDILAQPVQKITLRGGGANAPLTSSTAFIKKTGDKWSVAYLKDDNGRIAALLFDSLDSFGEYFALENASPVTTPPVNLIKTALPLSTLIFLCNLADCYRRAHLNGMLIGSTELVEAIYEDEFITVLGQELNSRDIRWLLPSLIRLVPGLAESKLEFSADDLEHAESMKFLTRTRNPKDERPLYLMGPSGKYLGLEFTMYWTKAVGFEVTTLNHSGYSESCGRYFFASTDEANHLLSLNQTKNGIEFIHLALTLDQTVSEIKKILVDNL